MTRSISLQRAAAAIAVLGLAAAAFVAVSTTGHAAQASPSQAEDTGDQVTSLFFLSVAPRNGPVTTAILFCPPGGLHPYPVSACTDLSKAWGDFTKLPGVPNMACPDIYDPVVASAFGWWTGPLVWFTRTYSNMCDLHATTGWVFPLPATFPPPPSPQPTRPTSSSTVTTVPGPTATPPPWPTRTTGTGPAPTVPGPTVTIDPPDTTIPN